MLSEKASPRPFKAEEETEQQWVRAHRQLPGLFRVGRMGKAICSHNRQMRCGYKCFKMGAGRERSLLVGERETSCLLLSACITLFVRHNAASVGNCFFSIVSNKIRGGDVQGQNARQSQETVHLKIKSQFVISVNQLVSSLSEGTMKLLTCKPV